MINGKVELKRDHVQSVTRYGDSVVGVYFMKKGKEVFLGAVPPELADKIINLWESYEEYRGN